MKRRVLVTGGSRGIGSKIAELFRERGYDVCSPSRAELNLLSLDSIEEYFAKNSEFDILINNAGVNWISPVEEIKSEHWEHMVAVNLTAPFKIIQCVLPHMKAKRWGRIVNISSIFSNLTKAGRAPYSATKSGLNGLTRTVAVEVANFGILVNAVCPGYVETQLTFQNNTPAELEKIMATIPARRMANPREICEVVEFLCSERNSYLTGQMITVDGGFSIQ